MRAYLFVQRHIVSVLWGLKINGVSFTVCLEEIKIFKCNIQYTAAIKKENSILSKLNQYRVMYAYVIALYLLLIMKIRSKIHSVRSILLCLYSKLMNSAMVIFVDSFGKSQLGNKEN